jgi:hypothetical protein
MSVASYSKFTHDAVLDLGLKVQAKSIFPTLVPILQPSDHLVETLTQNEGLPMSNSKAKSEFIVAPILREIRKRNIDKMTFFSGYNFNVDSKRGLKGRCDFILSLMANTISITAPLFCLVEAKNDAPDDENSISQCIAEMYAARLFNEKRKNNITIIYGAVTNGYEWIFIQLIDDTAFVDIEHRHSVNNLPQLLGIFQYIIDLY